MRAHAYALDVYVYIYIIYTYTPSRVSYLSTPVTIESRDETITRRNGFKDLVPLEFFRLTDFVKAIFTS